MFTHGMTNNRASALILKLVGMIVGDNRVLDQVWSMNMFPHVMTHSLVPTLCLNVVGMEEQVTEGAEDVCEDLGTSQTTTSGCRNDIKELKAGGCIKGQCEDSKSKLLSIIINYYQNYWKIVY